MKQLDKLRTLFKSFLRKDDDPITPILPAGSVDTSEFNEQMKRDVERLDGMLGEEPDAYRKMMLYSYYRKGDAPDFNEMISSLLYKVRLCNTYLLNYYVMYRLLIPALIEAKIEEMRILVLGCGSMIDAASLSYAKVHENAIAVDYTGVDIANWPSVYDTPFEKRFVCAPLQDYWNNIEVFDGNVIFFSTVLSELRECPDETEELCQGLEQATFTSDVVFLLASYRSTVSYKRDWRFTDWQKMQSIIATIEKKGYKAEPAPVSIPEAWKTNLLIDYAEDEHGNEWPCYYLADPNKSNGAIGIKDLAPDFAVPDSVVEYLENPGYIRKRCPYYQARKEQYDRQNPENASVEENPLEICMQQCPINCFPKPKTLFTNRNSPCFQIIVFRSTSTAESGS